MKVMQIPALSLAALAWFTAPPASAHPGALDGNGCHYDTATGRYHCHRAGRKNPDVNAPAKRSRENVCHDQSSPNYSTLKYFLSYPSLQACLTSGERPPGS
jgi:hypothetical protein